MHKRRSTFGYLVMTRVWSQCLVNAAVIGHVVFGCLVSRLPINCPYMEFPDATLGGLAPSVNSLCRWQEKRTMRKPRVQIGNFGCKKEAS